MRSSIADYEVIELAPAGPAGQARFLCRPPTRLLSDEPVTVTELRIDAGRWQQLADQLVRIACVPAADLLALLEVGPDLDPVGAGVYLATEAAPGGSLSAPAGPLERPARVAAVAAAARAAHAMHEAGLAHGSISTGSILLTARGPVLGPPRLDDAPGEMGRISAWEDLVTVDPDLICGESPSRSSDVWSLGASLHAALSDRPLYPGITGDEPVTAVQRVLFTRPEVDGALPEAIVETIRLCLQPDPASRPETALEVADRLARVEVAQ